MKTILKNSIALAATALIVTTASSQAQTAYTIGDNGTALVKFELATPGTTTLVGNFAGALTSLSGIDFRPANGLLYGYDQLTNRVVTIDLNTAATTLVSTPTTGASTTDLGIDFNPVADRLRVVDTNDSNLRINVATGVTTVDGPLTYAAGDPNVGANPSIIEAAYTNSDVNPGTGTSLFYIDNTLDILVSTINPNAGSLTTVGALGFNTTNFVGFDILSDGFGGNSAYALLTAPSGIASLHSINLATGAATSLGVISQTAASRPYGLAIVQPVPEPGTALFGLALAGASLARNRRKSAARA